MDTEKVHRYFERIGMEMPEKIVPNSELLNRLHYMHSISVPYENLDYLTGKIAPTDADTAYRNIVLKHRGGLCLDLNTLFGWLLKELGYGVEYAGADMSDRSETDIRWHKMLRVTDCDGQKWWCDVARMNSSIKHPLLMEPGLVHKIDGEVCLLENDGDDSWSLWLLDGDIRIKKYEVSDWNATVDETNYRKFSTVTQFPEHPILTGRYFEIRTPFGRRSLYGNIYRESFNNTVYKFECSDETLPWAYAQFGLRSFL